MPDHETPPRRLRWEHSAAGRYYEAHLNRDLFGQWVLTRVWGRRESPRGRVVHTPCASHNEACNQLAKIIARRRLRGYTAVITH
ncbi:MAG TPA: WGR domain-containing protein [Gammaproteobacteria bacterium]|nr:WGR domain-containing protein [Gammaproteobacteria bacterium]